MIKVELLRHPTEEDWLRCKTLALNTVGKKAVNQPTDKWKHDIIKCAHSPIRTLMFTIRMEIPYYTSVHFVRHKYGVEHYVTSQRNDRQDNYDRTKAPQDSPVVHIMDVNAQELIFMAHKRLCNQADPMTREVMRLICDEVAKTNQYDDRKVSTFLDSKTLDKAKNCISALQNNKKVQELLHPKGLLEDW